MSALVPLNRKNNSVSTVGYEDFYSMLDDFFGDGWWSNRSLLRDSFKIEVKETEHVYVIEAELPGVKKEDIDLCVENQTLSICVFREEDSDYEKNDHIHNERQIKSMEHRIRLGKAKHGKIEAILNEGVLTVLISRDKDAPSEYKINIK